MKVYVIPVSCGVSRSYLDSIAEEINDKLQDQGQITVAQLTKEYDLPGDFLAQVRWRS